MEGDVQVRGLDPPRLTPRPARSEPSANPMLPFLPPRRRRDASGLPVDAPDTCALPSPLEVRDRGRFDGGNEGGPTLGPEGTNTSRYSDPYS